MPARLKLTVDWFNKRLVKSNANSTPFTLPHFFQGDIVPMQVQIVEPDPNGGPNDYVIVDISSAALKLGVSDTPTGTAGGPTPFVTQFTWSSNTNENYFYGEVAFNTAALTTYLGSERTKSPWMELEITEGTAITTIWQGQITLDAEINEVSTAAVAPGETALSMEIALQIFAKKFMDPGESITFPSADGTRRTIIYTHDDGSWHEDSL